MLFQSLELVLGLTFLFLVEDVHCQRICGLKKIPNVQVGSPWPWMVAITKKGSRDLDYRLQCSGFLIDSLHVLTVASCFHNKNVTLYQTRIGHVDLTRGEVYGIVSIVTHADFIPYTSNDNIAILTLDRPVTEPGFNPVCLPDEEVRRLNLDNMRTTVVGWGQGEKRRGMWNTVLQQLKGMPVVSNQECDRAYREKIPEMVFQFMFPKKINDKIICAGFPEGRKEACEGASGGPLMIQRNNSWYAVGINSFGFSCGVPGMPTGFTRVSEYLEWIWEHAWKY